MEQTKKRSTAIGVDGDGARTSTHKFTKALKRRKSKDSENFVRVRKQGWT